ncbi:MY18B protein, partial [Asarcornis scutulata]|nr:MY18B protein [Asarcornis scutulata]
MAISSRLALWEQKGSIREEDRAPPPSAPPLLLSVIPGGFIKQLVRETEKESKEARLKKKAKATVKEDVSTEQITTVCPPCSTRVVAALGQLLQNGLHVEGQGGEGAPAPPNTALPPGRAAPGPGPCKAPAPTPSPAETPHPGAPE